MAHIPTAKEFALKDGWDKVIDHVTIKRMQDFAKLHVEAALKAAANEYFPKEKENFELIAERFINAYPLNLIK